MSKISVFVGLDYHDQSVQVCAIDAEGRRLLNRSLPNDVARIRQAAESCGTVVGAALEACCGAADLADQLALQANWRVALAHPGYVSRLKQSRDKTDLGDARLLADLLRTNYLPRVWLAPEDVRRLRRLVRHRQQLVDQLRSTKLRIRALLRENRRRGPEGVSPWRKAWLAWLAVVELHAEDRWLLDRHLETVQALKQQIRAVEQLLVRRLDTDVLAQRLLQLPGVGLVTAATLRAEVGRFDRFANGKQLARFCGLSPRNASSGQRQADAGLIKAGNSDLRRVLIELGHRLLRQPGRWQQLGYTLLRAGKPRNVVVAAVANRWMRWLHHHLTSSHETPCDPAGGASPCSLPASAPTTGAPLLPPSPAVAAKG
jgi:transposase